MWGQKTNALFNFDRVGSKSKRVTNVTESASKGAFVLTMADTSEIYSGDQIALTMKNPAAEAQLLAGRTVDEGWTALTDGMQVRERHQISEVIDSTHVRLVEPMMTDIDAAHGWNVALDGLTPGWGVEDLHLNGGWEEGTLFLHHNTWLADLGWKMISFHYGLEPYVRRVRITEVTGKPVTFENCFGGSCILTAIEGTQGHSSFTAKTFSFGTLFAFTHDDAQFHGHAASVGAVGTVITNSKVSDRGLDWHGNYPYATLTDANTGGLLGWGGNTNSLPNHLQDLTFWNHEQTAGETWHDFDWWEHSGGGANPAASYTPKCVYPSVIGFFGHKAGSFQSSSCKLNESPGVPVSPPSLYEAQLELRLGGKIPAWWSEAKEGFAFYKANGYFDTPLFPPSPPLPPASPPLPPHPPTPPIAPLSPSAPPATPPQPPGSPPPRAWCSLGLVGSGAYGSPRPCCAVSCGRCGGKGCGSLTGGADLCCPGQISRNALVCPSTEDVGCVIPLQPPPPAPPPSPPPPPPSPDPPAPPSSPPPPPPTPSPPPPPPPSTPPAPPPSLPPLPPAAYCDNGLWGLGGINGVCCAASCGECSDKVGCAS